MTDSPPDVTLPGQAGERPAPPRLGGRGRNQPDVSFPRATLTQCLILAVFVACLGGWFIANRVVVEPDISVSERRPLAKPPALTWQSVVSGQYMTDFEDYAADGFAGREGWRGLHAWTVLYPYCQLDQSGLYLGDAGLGRFQRLDTDSARQVATKINQLAASLPQLQHYYAVIPDKSVYAGRYLPGFDAAEAAELLAGELPQLTAIDLSILSMTDSGAPSLSADDFYFTDLHWKQPHLSDVVWQLAVTMGFEPAPATAPQSAGTFRGAYAGQWALPVAAEPLEYLPQPGLHASYLDPKTLTWQAGEVYQLDKIDGIDPYDLFLGGPQPLIRLENPAATSGRELFLFRDSFGSSLAPLLAAGYSRVTLIDLRYINWRLVEQLVDFPAGSDALYLYSSQILNSSSVLMVD